MWRNPAETPIIYAWQWAFDVARHHVPPAERNERSVITCTVDRWKKVPEFQARLKENIAAFRTKFLECGLARQECRLADLQQVSRLREAGWSCKVFRRWKSLTEGTLLC